MRPKALYQQVGGLVNAEQSHDCFLRIFPLGYDRLFHRPTGCSIGGQGDDVVLVFGKLVGHNLRYPGDGRGHRLLVRRVAIESLGEERTTGEIGSEDHVESPDHAAHFNCDVQSIYGWPPSSASTSLLSVAPPSAPVTACGASSWASASPSAPSSAPSSRSMTGARPIT